MLLLVIYYQLNNTMKVIDNIKQFIHPQYFDICFRPQGVFQNFTTDQKSRKKQSWRACSII